MNRLHPSDDGSSPFTRGPTRPRHCALAARQTTDPCFEHFRVVVHWFHPETAMYYRAYILDQEGRIRGCRELICLNDEEAKQKAIQILDGHDIEVWQEKRQVFTLRHSDRN
jgi:hypothetical protein